MKNEEYLIKKICWYYYFENYTQKQIAELLNISRFKVIGYLQQAKDLSIISFNLNLNEIDIELESKIRNKYDLTDVIIVPFDSEKNSTQTLNQSIAKAAALYLNTFINNTNSYNFNIGYGETMNFMINYLAQISKHRLNLVSLTGGVANYLPNSADVFNANLSLIPSPFILSNKNLKEGLLLDKSIIDIINLIPYSDASIIGIGSLNNNSSLYNQGLLSNNNIQLLKMKGAVGDILGHFIDKNGNLIETELDSNLMSTELATLQSLNNVIAVAGGDNKVESIIASLVGNYVDILVTDIRTAKKLV